MLHRKELYNSAIEWQGAAEMLRKNRNVPLGCAWLNYQGQIMRFTPRTDPPQRAAGSWNIATGNAERCVGCDATA